jgi:hypothetical protein
MRGALISVSGMIIAAGLYISGTIEHPAFLCGIANALGFLGGMTKMEDIIEEAKK